MSFRVLLLTTGCAALAGMVAAPVAQAQKVTVKDARILPKEDFEVPPDYTIDDGPPPAHIGDISTDPEEILTQSSDETMQRISDHFKKTYGSEAGPIAELEEKERQVEAARRKVAVYSMTPDEREAYYEEEARAQAEAAQPQGRSSQGRSGQGGEKSERKPWSGYGAGKTPATPPRLFNNAQ